MGDIFSFWDHGAWWRRWARCFACWCRLDFDHGRSVIPDAMPLPVGSEAIAAAPAAAAAAAPAPAAAPVAAPVAVPVAAPAPAAAPAAAPAPAAALVAAAVAAAAAAAAAAGVPVTTVRAKTSENKRQ